MDINFLANELFELAKDITDEKAFLHNNFLQNIGTKYFQPVEYSNGGRSPRLGNQQRQQRGGSVGPTNSRGTGYPLRYVIFKSHLC